MLQSNHITKTKIQERFAKVVFTTCAIFSVFAVFAILFYILYRSIPVFREIGIFNFIFGKTWAPTKEFLAIEDRFGILPMIVSSFAVTIFATAIGTITGISLAVFLVYFCPKKLVGLFEQVMNLLAGIPSIIYGFFGLVVVVPLLAKISPNGNGKGLLAAAIILGIMIIPTIANLAKNAIESVSRQEYEGSIALGASKEQTIFKVVLPAAKSGIISSVVLGVGRAIGETMAVMMVAGNSTLFPTGFFSSIRTLTTNIVLEMSYATALHKESLIATGCILLVIILILNLLLSLTKFKIKERKIKIQNKPNYDMNYFVKQGHVSSFLKYLSIVISSIVMGILAVIIAFVLIKGIPHISYNLLFGKSGNAGMTLAPAFATTGMLILISLIIALPIGIGSAIYMVEYAKKGSKLVKVIRLFTDTLAGIPSIVFGLFGMILFCDILGFGYSILSGGLTLALMVLPTIERSTEESLLAIPMSVKEGSYALGASKVRTILKIILPAAVSGIATAIILSIGRVIGESAALIYTTGAVAYMPTSIFDEGASFAVMMWMFAGEGLYIDSAYATAAVLLIMVFVLNFIVWAIKKKIRRTY